MPTLSLSVALGALADAVRGERDEKAGRRQTVPLANGTLVHTDNSRESLKKNLLKLTSAFSSYRNKDKYNIKKCIAFLRSNSSGHLNAEILSFTPFAHT